ncbi:DoxX-like family protein [Evansella caseinilytica]|uniref:DoxX-like family protein n=1 Tax=Evansella caseinilytica TaxID=1503961 RepID=A0A1H3SR73_9BACI|nr:DoxX family protein [Evansella caseinilytica]SDZ39619.1 DoxX-like family protein [Evansella caseinilytica]
MNIALWIVQGILGAGFIFSGWMKAFQYEKAKKSWPWVNDVSRWFVFFIGIVELLGVLGLILPQATGIAPGLTPMAAFGLAAIVFFGAVFHVMRKEYTNIGVNIVFLVLSLFVAVGRMLY